MRICISESINNEVYTISTHHTDPYLGRLLEDRTIHSVYICRMLHEGSADRGADRWANRGAAELYVTEHLFNIQDILQEYEYTVKLNNRLRGLYLRGLYLGKVQGTKEETHEIQTRQKLIDLFWRYMTVDATPKFGLPNFRPKAGDVIYFRDLLSNQLPVANHGGFSIICIEDY